MIRLSKLRNRILIYVTLLTLVEFFAKDIIKEHYSNIVFFVIGSGIIVSVILHAVVQKEHSFDDKLYEVLDVVSVVWSFFFYFYLIANFILFPARVNGTSMLPTFLDQDAIVLTHIKTIDRMDVYFVNATEERTSYYKDEYLLKRVIGLPGEVVDVKNGEVYIDGVLFEEDYVNTITRDFVFADVCQINGESCTVIPEDYYFVMGDNRANSIDSRVIGLIHKEDLKAEVIFNVSEVIR